MYTYLARIARKTVSNCTEILSVASLGELRDVKYESKSDIPVVYYWNGPDVPDWGLLTIRNIFRFHERVYFISDDAHTLDMSGVVNLDDRISLPEKIVDKMKEQTRKEIHLIHLSELKRTLLHTLLPKSETRWIYSALDVIIMKPLRTCDFLTLSWGQDDEEVLIESSLFCLNSTVLEYIHERQLEEYDSLCFDCLGSALFSDLFYENRYKWNVTLKKGFFSPIGYFEGVVNNPILQVNVDYLHVSHKRTLKNFEYYLNFTKRREWTPVQSSVCSVSKKEW